jgi:hypothetical protein
VEGGLEGDLGGGAGLGGAGVKAGAGAGEEAGDADGAGGEVGVDVHAVDPVTGRGVEGEAADDAVPVALGVVGDGVGVFAEVDAAGVVVDEEGEEVAAGFDAGEFVAVGDGEAVGAAEVFVAEPDAGEPVGAFELELDAAAGPGGGNLDLALIPGAAGVVGVGLEPEGDLEVLGDAVGGVFGLGEERAVVDGAGPGGVEADGVAEADVLDGAGEGDGGSLGEGLGEPALAFAGVLAVAADAPLAGEVEGGGGAGGGGGVEAGGHKGQEGEGEEAVKQAHGKSRIRVRGKRGNRKQGAGTLSSEGRQRRRCRGRAR